MVTGFAVCTPGTQSQTIGENQYIKLGSLEHVSREMSQNTHEELMICSDPVNPNNMLAGVMYSQSDFKTNPWWWSNIAFYSTFDGGKNGH